MQKHKIMAACIALLASVCLWVYAVTVVNPDDTITVNNIKVRIDGTDILEARGLMVTGGEDQKVSVKLKGRRSDLKELTSDTLVAVASVGRITQAGEQEISWGLEYPSSIASGDISIESRSSISVVIPISERVEKDVKLVPNLSVQLADGYWTNEELYKLSTEYLTVIGPADETSKIDHAEISIERTGLSYMISEDRPVVFVDGQGQPIELSQYCTCSVDTVNCTIPVYPYKEVKLAVSLISEDGATADNTTYTVSPESIIVTGTHDALENVPDTLNIANISLGDDVTKIVKSIPMAELSMALPDSVIIRNEEENVTVDIDLTKVGVKTFVFSSTDIERLDQEDLLSVADSEISVILRGSISELDRLTQSDIKLSVDLNSEAYDAETKTAEVYITLPENSTLVVYNSPCIVNIQVSGAETGN